MATPTSGAALGATKWLQVDLGSNQNLNRFVVQHAGAGGENTAFNTRAFNIQVSTNGTAWTTVATVTANTANTTTHNIATVSARYIRLNVTTPTQNTDQAARIYEFEAYGSSTPPPSNLALNKPATADSSCNANEGPAKAVNGTVNGGNTDKWCSLGATKWLRVDLGASTSVGRLVVRHAGAGGESAAFNTRDFDLQVSPDGTTWTTVASPRGNTANVTTHTITPVSARYVRLNVIAPTSNADTAARVYELEVYAS